jgi:hypothetical protein
MHKFKYRFLVGSMILTFMGAMLKLNGLPNYNASLIGGILNFGVFIYLLLTEKKEND